MNLRFVVLAALAAALVAGCGAPATSLPPASPVAPPADAQPLVAAPPTAVSIPALGARSTLVATGRNPDGSPEVPPVDTPEQASWASWSPEPGTVGPAVLFGHVDGDGGRPGVFFGLSQLTAGDRVLVDRADGSTAGFLVYRVEALPKADFDVPAGPATARVYGDVPSPELRLVTCGGDFDRATGSYRNQVIAYAHLAPELLP